ncbi:hypothetical protein AF332_00080 [Sporosarcina globispora]|uniref:Aerobactin siderophore biosynthesis IucA/IucC-like C-terminal domain-containing protein n=1 Tax=Sporosarcina globispora TaxID=1459 RepID=A0A0M0G7M0_SPOGL|nr:IucA/IucC family C-terminal-domain containing protein [Sporosarcina globispora]KON85426.1 hypothetical protein AF332_00080 [Sporosarcina globispora]
MSSVVVDKLKTFDIYLEHERSKEIAITDLLNEEKCLSFLQKQMIEIKAPNLSVTASMLLKRYAYLVVSSTIYSMVEFNCAPYFPVDACGLTNERTLCIRPDICHWQEFNNMEREKWQEKVLYDLFALHITPVIEILLKVARVPSSILWENTAIRINRIYRNALKDNIDSVKTKRLNSDFNFLKSASGNLFGLKENPLQSYLKIGEELRLNPYRKTCCMYCKLEKDIEEISYCNDCPIKIALEK